MFDWKREVCLGLYYIALLYSWLKKKVKIQETIGMKANQVACPASQLSGYQCLWPTVMQCH